MHMRAVLAVLIGGCLAAAGAYASPGGGGGNGGSGVSTSVRTSTATTTTTTTTTATSKTALTSSVVTTLTSLLTSTITDHATVTATTTTTSVATSTETDIQSLTTTYTLQTTTTATDSTTLTFSATQTITATELVTLTATATVTSTATSAIQSLALNKVLSDAAPVFGTFSVSSASTANWMSAYPDSTLLTDMNIPGVHDAATWNYTDAEQSALAHVTAVGGAYVYPAIAYRCQEQSMAALLDAGVRFFDLRVAFDVVNSTLVFWHSSALQSQTATFEDVLFGFYRWLDAHPTEMLFVSVMREIGTKLYAPNTAAEELAIYNALTNPAAQQYLLQTRGVLGTLGEARGRVVLLRRFTLDLLDSSYDDSLPGLYMNPSLWLDNNANFTLVYNSSTGASAYIEDYYETSDQGYELNIQQKYNATIAHLALAAAAPTGSTGDLYITFASGEHDFGSPNVVPVYMALGVSSSTTPTGGVNTRLAAFLPSLAGKRLGIVAFDY
ncbi:hypothetical protein HK405_011741, partial [Cladochytrium tenue]